MSKQRGFTLIELMISMVLGLLTVLVITQVTVQAEGRKRTVSMGSDAQINGSLSLFALQRDIQMAGYGAVASPDALGCTVSGKYGSSGSTFPFTLAPVVITDGASGAPDTITILQAHTHGFSVPVRVAENHPQAQNYFVVTSSLGVSVNDLMIAVPKVQGAGTMCTLFSVTSDTASANTTLSATRVPHTTAASWNQSSIFPASGYVAESYLLNMGTMVQRTYSVNAYNNLALAERSPTDGTSSSQELYPQIVNLQAMYGRDTKATSTGVVDTYDNTTPTTSADWLRVLTIRVAVVARTNQYEKEVVTNTAPLWDVGATAHIAGTTSCNGGSKCLSLKVDQIPDWQHYRYKVYETIVPLRNVLWNS